MQIRVPSDILPEVSQQLAQTLEAAERIEVRELGGQLAVDVIDPVMAETTPIRVAEPATSDAVILDKASLSDTVLTTLTGTTIPIFLLVGDDFFPLAPAGEPPTMLACGGSKVVAAGKGTAKEKYNIATGSPAKARLQAIRAAYGNAWENLSEAIAKLNVKCPKDCQLQLDIAFGSLRTADTADFTLGIDLPGPFDLGAPVTRRADAEIAWDVTVRCTKEPKATGSQEGDRGTVTKGIEGVARSCAGHAVGGTARGVTDNAVYVEFDKLLKPDREALNDFVAFSRAEAITNANKAIRKALETLPHCPSVSCPKEKIRVYVGPFSTVVQPVEFPRDPRDRRAVSEAAWRIVLECSK